jgi:hypothetical protein
VKNYIALLESNLAETKLELQKALETIAELRADLSNCNAPFSSSSSATAKDKNNPTRSECSTQTQLFLAPVDQGKHHPLLSSCLDWDNDKQIHNPHKGTGPCCKADKKPRGINAHTDCQTSYGEEGSEQNSLHVPETLYNVNVTAIHGGIMDDDMLGSLEPPAPTESTTRCRDALTIIEAQNFRNLEPDAIRVWLEPGFRKAMSKGDGCRVENNLLFALLNHINPA